MRNQREYIASGGFSTYLYEKLPRQAHPISKTLNVQTLTQLAAYMRITL